MTKIGVEDFCFIVRTDDEYLQNYLNSLSQDFNSDRKEDYHINVFVGSIDNNPVFVDNNYYLYKMDFDISFMHHKKENIIILFLPGNDDRVMFFKNFMKRLFSGCAIKKGMLLLHASCILKHNKAIIFTGNSGAGKSTIALLSGFPIVHDDLIVLKYLGNDLFKILAFPFKENLTKIVFEGKIETFYQIIQSNNNFVAELTKRQQLIVFITSLWKFNDYHNQSYYNLMLFNHCRKIFKKFPIKQLYFTKSKGFLEYI